MEDRFIDKSELCREQTFYGPVCLQLKEMLYIWFLFLMVRTLHQVKLCLFCSIKIYWYHEFDDLLVKQLKWEIKNWMIQKTDAKVGIFKS